MIFVGQNELRTARKISENIATHPTTPKWRIHTYENRSATSSAAMRDCAALLVKIPARTRNVWTGRDTPAAGRGSSATSVAVLGVTPSM